MAEYQITYWRDLPAMVTARAGRRKRAKVELSPRFQAAIDEAAMRAGMADTDAYLSQWRRSDWMERPGTPEEVAQAVAAELEATYPAQRLRDILQQVAPSDP